MKLNSSNSANMKRAYRVQVFDRIMAILGCFTHENPERAFADILRQVKLDKSTLYRLLEVLRSYEIITFDRISGKYSLGMKLFELGTVSIARLEVSRLAMPALEWLVEQTGETAHLCVLDRSEVLYIAKVESRLPFHMPSNLGRRNLAYCTAVGKALLAFLPEERLDEYLANTPLHRLTENTITSAADLKKRLRQIRNRGFSTDNQELEAGLRSIGAPVRDHTGAVVAAVSIAGPATRMSKKNRTEQAAYVMAAAERISASLGYSGAKRNVLVSGRARNPAPNGTENRSMHQELSG